MATETDRPFYESFDNGVGALSHTWAGNIDRSVGGEIKLSGYSGTMEFPSSTSAGHGYGTYKIDAKLDGNQPGPAILLWPGNNKWPGQEMNLVEMLPGGQQYGTVHWDDNGNSYTARMFDGVSGSQFHEYTLVWEPGRITFMVDGAEKGVVTNNVPADHDNGGMNNVVGVMNTNDSTSLTVRSVEYQPLGGGAPAPAPSQPASSAVVTPPPSEPVFVATSGSAPSAPASSGGGKAFLSLDAAVSAIGWDAVAAQVTTHSNSIGQWAIPSSWDIF